MRCPECGFEFPLAKYRVSVAQSFSQGHHLVISNGLGEVVDKDGSPLFQIVSSPTPLYNEATPREIARHILNGSPDVVVLGVDIVQTRDGLQVASILKRAPTKIKIIFVSTRRKADVVWQGLADGYFEIPLDTDELGRAIDKLLS